MHFLCLSFMSKDYNFFQAGNPNSGGRCWGGGVVNREVMWEEMHWVKGCFYDALSDPSERGYEKHRFGEEHVKNAPKKNIKRCETPIFPWE